MTDSKPGHYQSIRDDYPDFIEAVENLGESVRASGPLDEFSAQLVQLAAAVAIRSEGAVHSHVRRAREEGASDDEIRHAIILLTSTLGFPAVMAALSWADDILLEE